MVIPSRRRGILVVPVEGLGWRAERAGHPAAVGESHVRQSLVVGPQFSVPVPSDWG
jgi:hypothetical protein